MTATFVLRREDRHFDIDRHCYLVTRALLRTVLSRYAAVKPQEWALVPSGMWLKFCAAGLRRLEVI